MNPAGPSLRDIQLPPEPGWWPPAPGWWLLALLALAAALLLARLALRWRRRRVVRREARRLVADCLHRHVDAAALAAGLSALLRRAARASDPGAATLSGEDWLRWLDADDPSRPFAGDGGRLLLEAPFRTDPPRAPLEALAPAVEARLARALLEARR